MDQVPSGKTNGHSSNQEIPCPLWDPKVYYRDHKRPELDHVRQNQSKSAQSVSLRSILKFPFHLYLVSQVVSSHKFRKCVTMVTELLRS
jgi:hypothetical protein